MNYNNYYNSAFSRPNTDNIYGATTYAGLFVVARETTVNCNTDTTWSRPD